MTRPRGLPAAARWGLVCALTLIGAAAAAPRDADREGLTRKVSGAEVDWAEGTVAAQAGAAADIRMPSADVARPGAERRARAAALEVLREALGDLPASGKKRLDASAVESMLAKAQTRRSEYQSNGGVLVTVQVRFADVRPEEARPKIRARLVLAVPSMPLEVTPVLARGERQVTLDDVVYRVGAPPRDVDPVTARRDRAGRLVVTADIDKFASAPVLIYVQRVLR